jgi:hypothetical protein
MLALFCAFGSFSAKGQFLPDAEFYIYLTDVRGNKDSILFSYGGAPYTFIDSGYCGTGIGLGAFNDTLELRILSFQEQNTWKHYCAAWDCNPVGNQYSFPFELRFTAMYPPIRFSWDQQFFQDTCIDNSTISPNLMQLVHPHIPQSLRQKFADQDYLQFALDTTDFYSMPIYQRGLGQSGDTILYYSVYFVLANAPLTVDSRAVASTANGFKVYPTVFEERIWIEGSADAFEYRLYNAQGQLVRQGQGQTGALYLQGLAQGFYVLELQQGQERQQVKLIRQ